MILKPIKHTWVRDIRDDVPHQPNRNIGQVQAVSDTHVHIKLSNGSLKDIPHEFVGCGLQPNMVVREIPQWVGMASLGEGKVIRTRTLGQSEQALVMFETTGDIRWLPYQRLQQIKDAKQRFITQQFGQPDNVEKFRLKTLAYALEMWHENTGALSHLEIDPLPHQIHLVHHILSSGNLNWLIADDVGLGKTIETGMLLSALKQRGLLNRVLLITPAGLTRQWQEELHHKFQLDSFQIFGEDFHINESRHWRLYDFVIASVDSLKKEEHLEQLQQGGRWDLIIFDEAHRLSRRQYGMKYQTSERFDLAKTLRQLTDSMILLSATPHQGMTDKFQALLELLHPERKAQIRQLELQPEIIQDMVFRNNKSEVTDLDGQLIFKGKITRAIEVPTSDDFKQFDRDLQHYFVSGYQSAKRTEQHQARAIGFVMTVYRKLAASSIAAIHTALQRRLHRLQHHTSISLPENQWTEDERFDGEQQEHELWKTIDVPSQTEFFTGEIQQLNNLIAQAEKLLKHDVKCHTLVNHLIPEITQSQPHEKLLIFTEYKTTQQYLQQQLAKHYGTDKIGLIHGSMSHQHRREVIEQFENGHIQFLISTEAGGEGINLQRQCHIMVNYDLPWNPMRLVQRIGRLYRYGQQKKVIVFNIHSPDTADDKIVQLMYDRINQVVRDMAQISHEFNNGLHDDIFGELADLTDIETILAQASEQGYTQTQVQINQAIDRARDALIRQRELFEHAATFNPTYNQHRLPLSREHWQAFVVGMFEQLGIQYKAVHNPQTWDIVLPENIKVGRKSHFRVSVDRLSATLLKDVEILDLNHRLMIYFLEYAKSYDFKGQCSLIDLGTSGVYACNVMRWQNHQGQRRQQEWLVLYIDVQGNITCNPPHFADWLKQTHHSNMFRQPEINGKALMIKLDEYIDSLLAQQSNEYLLPESQQWLTIGVMAE